MSKLKCLLIGLLFTMTIAPVFADWKEDAEKRIEQHRKADVVLQIKLDGKPLKDAEVTFEMVDHDFLFGCNIFLWGRSNALSANEAYQKRYADLFNFATLGFYWWTYESEMGKPGYDYSERVADWCGQNGIRAKGHPLAWNFVDPHWAKDLDEDELYRLQMARITDCAARFAGKIDTWDVINEVVGWDREDCRKNSPHLTALMQKHDPVEFAKACFVAARKGNQDAKLLINDYITDQKYVELIEKLVDANGKPLYDIIGIQSHMHSGTWTNEQIWETCERYVKFDKPLHFTELTVLSNSGMFDWDNKKANPGTPEGEERQKNEVERIYTMLFSHPSVEAVTWWDFSDYGAWMQAPAGLVRADMSNKPAYDVLKKLIHETWATNATIKTDADGNANIRAFRGTYRLKIRFADGSEYKEHFPATVLKGKNEFLFELKK